MLILPVIKEFNSEFIIISSGFYSAKGDQLGGINLTPNVYNFMTTELMNLCSKVVIALEGGYNFKSISDSMNACVHALFGNKYTPFNNNTYNSSVIDSIIT